MAQPIAIVASRNFCTVNSVAPFEFRNKLDQEGTNCSTLWHQHKSKERANSEECYLIMETSILQDLTVIIPLHSEIEWYSTIKPKVQKLLNLGAKVIVGLNLKSNLVFEKSKLNGAISYQEFDELLSAGEHWTKLLHACDTKFFRYWFAGDDIHIGTLVAHINILSKNQNVSFVFSSRTAKYRNFIVPFELSKRKKILGESSQRGRFT